MNHNVHVHKFVPRSTCSDVCTCIVQSCLSLYRSCGIFQQVSSPWITQCPDGSPTGTSPSSSSTSTSSNSHSSSSYRNQPSSERRHPSFCTTVETSPCKVWCKECHFPTHSRYPTRSSHGRCPLLQIPQGCVSSVLLQLRLYSAYRHAKPILVPGGASLATTHHNARLSTLFKLYYQLAYSGASHSQAHEGCHVSILYM